MNNYFIHIDHFLYLFQFLKLRSTLPPHMLVVPAYCLANGVFQPANPWKSEKFGV